MTHRHPALRILKNIGGILLVLLGIAGLFLPILQGILFIFLGLAMIDLKAKHRLHRWLGHHFKLYRRVALVHHRFTRGWHRRRREHRQRKKEEGC